MKKKRFTIRQFNKKYPNDDACLREVFEQRNKDAKVCPSCKKAFKFYRVTNRKCFACSYCGYQIHPLAGTIFHKSRTGLRDWFFAIFLFSTSKNGVSAKEIERHIGVTYKTAWRMAKEIRKLFREISLPQLNGVVEMDETYIGGKERNKHYHQRTKGNQGRSVKTKTPVLGAIERKGKMVAEVKNHAGSSVITPFAKEYISIEAEIKTDEYMGYRRLIPAGYLHRTVNHGIKQYVDGDSHTNTVEGFWSQLKRSINGTYHAVSPKYLQSYVDEFSYRYNRREDISPLFFSLALRASTRIRKQ